MKIINQADEKYKSMEQELCEPLFAMLREINTLEAEIDERDKIHFNKCLHGDGEKEDPQFSEKLWKELKERYGEIVVNRCTDKLLDKGYGMSFSNPTKYHYIDRKCTVLFFMKESRKAIIEIHFMRGSLEFKHRFKFVKLNNKWLINAFDWYSSYDCVWHRGRI